ncbi:UNVERIFIED_CONTAM: hypothetical protein PYX00_008608 [Menopon gallinae]|uniref:Uncharacterized protein n=1 Tax=Menopon gallinae TaxID=328185 RepID=A0AAW2HNI6_9NEOP
MNGVKEVNETFVTDKMKEVVDSSAVQGVIGGVVSAKDEIVSQVQGAGETVVNKMSSVVEGVEESVDSTLSQITSKIEEIEENVKSEVKGVGDKISSFVGSAGDAANEKKDEIDELLAALPDENEIAAQSKATAEELIEAATEEVTEDEMKD